MASLSKQLRRLVGKRVTAIRLRPFSDGRGGLAYNPIIQFDDGSALVFSVDETEGSDYGVAPVYIAPAGKGALPHAS